MQGWKQHENEIEEWAMFLGEHIAQLSKWALIDTVAAEQQW
jgi:hypothetical protein